MKNLARLLVQYWPKICHLKTLKIDAELVQIKKKIHFDVIIWCSFHSRSFTDGTNVFLPEEYKNVKYHFIASALCYYVDNE